MSQIYLYSKEYHNLDDFFKIIEKFTFFENINSYMIFETFDEIKLKIFSLQVLKNVASKLYRIKIFNSDYELKLKKKNAKYICVIASKTDLTNLDDFERESNPLEYQEAPELCVPLWGKYLSDGIWFESRIPHEIEYPPIQDTDKNRIYLKVTSYLDNTKKVIYYWFTGLEGKTL